MDALAQALPEHCWQTRPAGTGAKGSRWYQWAYLHLDDPEPPAVGQRYLLLRRNPTTGETAFYRCWAPIPVGLNALIRTAGVRWKIEEAFRTGKGLADLDKHQVRRYISWCWCTVLVMLAHAYLRLNTDCTGRLGDDDTNIRHSDATTSDDRPRRYDKSRTSAGILDLD